jgi:hypothetical protein
MPADDPRVLSPEDRRRELAQVLARGLRRLLRPPDAPATPPPGAPENLSESRQDCLAVPAETRLSVSRVDAIRDA